MGDDLETAARYRERAKNLRGIANDKSASGIRLQLLKLADTYDHLATTLEEIDAANLARDTADLATSSYKPPKT